MPERPGSTDTAAIALGSNLPSTWGDPADNLREAVRRLGALGTVSAVSRFYRTAPVSAIAQPRFLNAAALLQTSIEPVELLHALLGIEHSMGRDREGAAPKGPRIIDLDLLLYGNRILRTPELHLPHPVLHERRFVLAPLAEVAPGMVHPEQHCSIATLLSRLPPEREPEPEPMGMGFK